MVGKLGDRTLGACARVALLRTRRVGRSGCAATEDPLPHPLTTWAGYKRKWWRKQWV